METRRDFLTAAAVGVMVLGCLRLSLAQYGGGTGEPNDPYQIWTAEQMNAIGTDPNDWDKHFKLMADLNLGAYASTGLPSIGSEVAAFTGTFDGNGHVVSNYVNVLGGGRSAGLFGYVSHPFKSDGSVAVKNLGLVDPVVDGGSASSTGALVGYLSRRQQVAGCFVKGGLVRGSQNAGGLAGYSEGIIIDCYASVPVIASGRAAGLVALNDGSLHNCYATGRVIGAGDVSGLAGPDWARAESATASFWDTTTSGQATSVGGTGLTTPDLQTASTFLAAGWDLVGETENGGEDVWWIQEGQGYPRLWWEAEEQ